MKKSCFLIILLLFIVGCTKPLITKYEFKKENGLIDKKVEIKQMKSENSGELEIRFAEKRLPLEFALKGTTHAYQLEIDVDGKMQYGNVTISLVSGNKEYFTCKLSPGKIKKTFNPDFYWGKYKVVIRFKDAQQGNIRVKYRILE